MLNNRVQIKYYTGFRRQCELLGKNRSSLYYKPIAVNAVTLLLMNLYDTKPDIRHRYLYMRHANESLLHKNRSSCGSGMPGATKYDSVQIELKMLKKIVKQKGKVSYGDIEEFQEKINRVKFNRKHANKALAPLIRT
jgi:hypothetical protein